MIYNKQTGFPLLANNISETVKNDEFNHWTLYDPNRARIQQSLLEGCIWTPTSGEPIGLVILILIFLDNLHELQGTHLQHSFLRL